MLFVVTPRFKAANSCNSNVQALGGRKGTMCVIVWPILTGVECENWKVYVRWGGPYPNADTEIFRICGQFHTNGLDCEKHFYKELSICLSRFTMDFGQSDLQFVNFSLMNDRDGIVNQVELVQQIKRGLVKDVTVAAPDSLVRCNINADRKRAISFCTVQIPEKEPCRDPVKERQTLGVLNASAVSYPSHPIDEAVARICGGVSTASRKTPISVHMIDMSPVSAKRLKTSDTKLRQSRPPMPVVSDDGCRRYLPMSQRRGLLNRIDELESQLRAQMNQNMMGYYNWAGYGPVMPIAPGMPIVPGWHTGYAPPGPWTRPLYSQPLPCRTQVQSSPWVLPPPALPSVHVQLDCGNRVSVSNDLQGLSVNSGCPGQGKAVNNDRQGECDGQDWECDYSPEISDIDGVSNYYSGDECDLLAPGLTGGTTSVGAAPVMQTTPLVAAGGSDWGFGLSHSVYNQAD